MRTTQPYPPLLRLSEVALRAAEIITKVSPGDVAQTRPGQADLSLQSLQRGSSSGGAQLSSAFSCSWLSSIWVLR